MYNTLGTGITTPSFMVKISDKDNDWEVSPCLRKAAPFSFRSFDNLSYNLVLFSSFEFEDPET